MSMTGTNGERSAAGAPGWAAAGDARTALSQRRLPEAETLIRARLSAVPADTVAIAMLAEIAQLAGRDGDAQRLLRHALSIAPDDEAARRALARALHRSGDYPEALAEFDRLLAVQPRHPGYRNTRASILDLLGDHAGALATYRAMLADDPAQPLVWMTIGNVLTTLGDVPGAVAAYRRSLALAGDTGESWWGLANLKSFRFDAADVAAMRARLARPALAEADRIGLHFALGKALEDGGDHAGSFAQYDAGNRLQLARSPHDPEQLATFTRRCAALFTRNFFAARAGGGDPAPGPIFIVGMPRSGSTLVEQILASHPAVEGTAELPELPRLVRALGGGGGPRTAPYPDNLATLTAAQLAMLGAEYRRRAARWRRTDRPFFIDKLPGNFMSIGLIRLILPRAKIIDVRRHPLGCGWSIFRQRFASGSSFATSLAHIGRFYADYVRMMELWDERLPGLVHRVFYERLVADTEAEVRRLLAFLGLPFDPACLAFHANDRPVRTPSAEQVRRPIHGAAVDHWRGFEPWLGPMTSALGEALSSYPPAR